MAASSVLQTQGLTQPEVGMAKARTRVAAHIIVVGLVGESGGMLAGRGPAPREHRVGVDEETWTQVLCQQGVIF